jgi:beta-phosphoglucomutase
MTQIRGVIFDMDGVLIDAREWHYQALNKILDEYGLPISREAHLTEFDGLPTRDKLNLLTARHGLPASSHDRINQMKQHYTVELIEQLCRPVEEHLLLLSQLKKQGYGLAVASNSIRNSIQSMLSKAGLLSFLDFFLSNEDVSQGKPSPEIYLKAIHRLELTPEECVVVEDNPHGIAAARAAGAHVLTVKDPSEVTRSRLRNFISKCENNDHSLIDK